MGSNARNPTPAEKWCFNIKRPLSSHLCSGGLQPPHPTACHRRLEWLRAQTLRGRLCGVVRRQTLHWLFFELHKVSWQWTAQRSCRQDHASQQSWGKAPSWHPDAFSHLRNFLARSPASQGHFQLELISNPPVCFAAHGKHPSIS